MAYTRAYVPSPSRAMNCPKYPSHPITHIADIDIDIDASTADWRGVVVVVAGTHENNG